MNERRGRMKNPGKEPQMVIQQWMLRRRWTCTGHVAVRHSTASPRYKTLRIVLLNTLNRLISLDRQHPNYGNANLLHK